MSLDETYDRILLGISRERQEYALRLFLCLAESLRPLHAEELAEILAVQFDSETLPNYDVNWRPPNPEEAVLSACSSLITIVDMGKSRVVQFSHFSVKEYLTSERLANAGSHLSQYHILPLSAHTILAQASLSVLLALDDQVDKEKMKNFPLAVYAARYWVDHAQFDVVSSRIKVAMEQLFDPAKSHFSAWVWIYDIDYKFREIMFQARPTPPKAVPLYYATLCGFRDLVEHLIITCPQDINTKGGLHATPLHTAVVTGNIDIMMLLLEHGADVAAGNWEEFTALFEASRRRRFDMMSQLLDHHADVNSRGKKGRTALLKAAFEGELDVTRVLLRHGAIADIGNTDGWTPLISASRHGHLDIARLLLQSGAVVDLHNNDGWTPLLSASQFGHSEVVSLLLQNGASVDFRNNDGWTSLMLASGDGHLDVTHSLLKNGASVDSRNNDGWTPLALASDNGHLDVVRLLLQNGARVDSCNTDGVAVDLQNKDAWTPLLSASRYGHLDVVSWLLQNGASVDTRINDGSTPLMLASRYGHPDVVHLLLQNGASVDSRNNYGRTPLALASEIGHPDIVRLLLQNTAAVNLDSNDSWPSNSGTSLFTSRYYAAVLPLHHRFKSGRPRLMYSSSSGIH